MNCMWADQGLTVRLCTPDTCRITLTTNVFDFVSCFNFNVSNLSIFLFDLCFKGLLYESFQL